MRIGEHQARVRGLIRDVHSSFGRNILGPEAAAGGAFERRLDMVLRVDESTLPMRGKVYCSSTRQADPLFSLFEWVSKLAQLCAAQVGLKRCGIVDEVDDVVVGMQDAAESLSL